MVFNKINFMLKNIHQKEKGFTLLYAVLVSSIILAASLSIINIALKQHKLAALSRESKIAFYAANTGIDCALYWNSHTRTVTELAGDTEINIFPSAGAYDDPARTDDDQNQAARTDSDDASDVINCLRSDIVASNNFYGYDTQNGQPIEMTYNFDKTENDSVDPTWIANTIFADADLQGEFCLDPDGSNNQSYRTWIFQMIMPNSDGSVASSKDNACAIVSVCKDVSGTGAGKYSTVFTAKGYNTCDITKENVVERGIRLMSD